MGLYTGGLIFGMVRVLVNWWAYTWGGAYIRVGLYSEVYGILCRADSIMYFSERLPYIRFKTKLGVARTSFFTDGILGGVV